MKSPLKLFMVCRESKKSSTGSRSLFYTVRRRPRMLKLALLSTHFHCPVVDKKIVNSFIVFSGAGQGFEIDSAKHFCTYINYFLTSEYSGVRLSFYTYYISHSMLSEI